VDSLDGFERRKRREKAGSHGVAEKLLLKRQAEKPEGVKLPGNLRAKSVTFGELCEDALKHSEAENSAKQTYELRLRTISFGRCSAPARPIPSAKMRSSSG
jgi:hypothetical protein